MNGRGSRERRALAVVETEIAVRAYTSRIRPSYEPLELKEPEYVLVLDTETRTDHAQALLFGSYRIYDRTGKLLQEGLIQGDRITPAELAVLRRYVNDHPSDIGGHLRLYSRKEFMDKVFGPLAVDAQARVVGFNLAFDCSRLAWGWRRAQNGGFSLRLFDWEAPSGEVGRNQFRPDLRIKSLDPRRSFHSFTSTARRGEGRAGRGRFTDLKTLAYALTDESHSLRSAGKAFGVVVLKDEAETHGVVTAEYIDYNRQDVRSTWALYQALMAEWDRHPLGLPPERAYSPAAVSKGYLGLAEITPPIERSDVPIERLGQAMTAYFGGRTECRIRGVRLPVRYLDFTSMYPTCFALLRLWRCVIAERLTSEDWTAGAQAYLQRIDREALHHRESWLALANVFCRVRPAGELLPVRARYAADTASDGFGSPAWTIGLNELESADELWFTLADLVEAKLLGGRAPAIVEAFRVVPVGQLPGLRPVDLRGGVTIDPRTDDLFQVAIEERARVRADENRPEAERERLSQFLKTFASGGSYGVFAEFRQLDPVPGRVKVVAHGLERLEARVTTPEEPGALCFPPIAASITGAARLLLALAQSDVEARGGTYVACDTDSLLCVASASGGLVACRGGSERLHDGRDAVRALSFAEVDAVAADLNRLNPYAPGTVASLVKHEKENFSLADPSVPEELWALASSSKRYVLWNETPDGVVIRKASWHGLGLYRSPLERREEWPFKGPEWADLFWRRAIAQVGREPVADDPEWFEYPAVSQLPVSSPLVIDAFRALNADRDWAEQVKPFNFILAGHVDPTAPLPIGCEPGEVTPMTQYTSKPGELLGQRWFNRRDGRAIEVTTKPGGEPGKVRLQTYGDVVRTHAAHPEHKSADPSGGLGHRGSIGLLPRLRVRATGFPIHLGKESNRLDDVQDGQIHDGDEVYLVYRDERREWEAALPALRRVREERGWRYLAERSGLSERAVRYALKGGKVPHEAARKRLLVLVPGQAATNRS